MISAEGKRNFSGLECLEHQLRMLGAGCSDLLQILRVSVAFFLLFRNRDGNVAAVFHLVSQGLKASLKSGHADRRWAHVGATARLAKIEGGLDDATFSAGEVGRR